jgi:hypothetical protein
MACCVEIEIATALSSRLLNQEVVVILEAEEA